MIVRNLESEEVQKRWYVAHGGGTATMLFDSSELQGILFFAHGLLKPGDELETHVDPYEEIYYVLKGESLMRVGNDEQQVKAGDAVWIPIGVSHSMANTSDAECIVVVTAAFPRDY